MIRLILLSSILLISGHVLAQAYNPPRAASGKPDLQGYWTNASITTLQRASSYTEVGLIIPQEQLELLTENNHQNVRQATDDGQVQGQLPDGKDLARGRGYNAFWVDPGTRFGVINGEARTSWITIPANGRIPFSEEGSRLRREAFARSGNDGPEGRSLGERCIIGFGSTGGPLMNNVLYNNLYQFVQTDDYLTILVEMVHDTRIIPINGTHRPAELQPWLGDSVAWWDDDTLVVETVNLHPQQAQRNVAPLSSQGKVVERFTRHSDTEIYYRFEVTDPVYYTEDWGGEMVFNRTDTQPYEYACHEGNYGLTGILAGARRLELDPPSD
ncbi:MAG: hypothetical protein OXD01_16190 [Gammaproteobacteria bacterium]|nr:hypothetical protein [Gammaproteobacteria bacterium]